jgi:transposase
VWRTFEQTAWSPCCKGLNTTHEVKRICLLIWFTTELEQTQVREDRFRFRLEGGQDIGDGVCSRAMG